MKAYRWVALMLLAVGLALFGCSKKENTTTVDTAPLEKSFQTSDPTTKSSADKAISAIKGGDYTGALAELKTLASNAKLTPEQQQAIKDVSSQVQTAVANMASQTKEQATKSMEDLKKSLPK